MIRSAIAVAITLLLGSEGYSQSFLSQKGYFKVNFIRACVPFEVEITVIPSDPNNCRPFDFYPDFKPNDPNNIRRPGGTADCKARYTYDPSITKTETITLRVLPSDRGQDNPDDIQITLDPQKLPEFKTLSCNNSKVQVVVTDKNYDQYFVDFNEGPGSITALPAGNNPTAEFTYLSSGLKSISVKGRNINGANNCNAQGKNFTAVTNLPDATIQSFEVLKDATTLELAYTPVRDVQYRADLAINNASTFQTLKNPFFDATAPQKETFTGLKTNENFYCLRLRKYDPCANTTEVIASTPVICSMTTTLKAESKKNLLTWTQGPPIVTSYTVKRNTDSNFLNTTDTSLQDSDVVCKSNYCYQVTAAYPGNAKSISSEKCIDAFSSETPDPIEDITSVVEPTEVLLSWPEPVDYNATTYSVRRASGNLNFLTIDEVSAPTYSDTEYSQEKTTAYQIAYTDACDNKSPASTTVRPLNLTGKVNIDNSIRIEWNAYRAYKDGVSEYQVTKFNKDNVILQTLMVADTFLLDNTPDPANQQVRYRITALPTNPSIEKSLSNTAEFTRQARLVFPTAFTPDGTGPVENESFRVFGEYISGIQLQIFDRWGKLLFTSNDLTIPWDGKSEGEELPQSSYVWRAEITDLLGKTFIRTGSVVLLRK